MEPSQQFIDALYADKVRRAREMSPEKKLMAGAELFDYMSSIALAGIRHQNPNATPERVREIFRERLKLARQRDDCR